MSYSVIRCLRSVVAKVLLVMHWAHHRRSNSPYVYKACWNKLYRQPPAMKPLTLTESNVLEFLYAAR